MMEKHEPTSSATTRVRAYPESRATFGLEDGTSVDRCGVACFDCDGRMFVILR